jgi:hypothetical protein
MHEFVPQKLTKSVTDTASQKIAETVFAELNYFTDTDTTIP